MPSTRRPAPRRSLGPLALGLALLALACAVHTQTGLAATSETCLRRCLAVCSVQDKDGGEACLRPCLKDCPAQCGTVGLDCALDCLQGSDSRTQASGPDPSAALAALAGKCAAACVVKPDCRPVDPDYVPGPPADFRREPGSPPPADFRPAPAASAPAPSAAPAVSPASGKVGAEAWKRYEPKGKYFSLPLPPGWTILEEEDALAVGRDFELKLRLPGEAGLDYALISVRYVASPHRTAERFLHELGHPAHGPAAAQATRASLSGRAVWRAETSGVRTLIGSTAEVPNLVRNVVLPLSTGFFVLTLDTPRDKAERLGPVFERLAREFRPLAPETPRGPGLSERERSVWADFFISGGKIKRPAADPTADPTDPAAPPLPTGLEDSERYLEDTARSGVVSGRTLAAPALDQAGLARLTQGCAKGLDLAALAQAWAAVRSQQVLVTDDLILPGPGLPNLTIREEPLGRGAAASSAPMRLRPPSGQAELTGKQGLFGGVAHLSRVAFSADGRTALVYVAHGQTSPGTSHFVLLVRSGLSWAVRCVGQHSMIIF